MTVLDQAELHPFTFPLPNRTTGPLCLLLWGHPTNPINGHGGKSSRGIDGQPLHTAGRQPGRPWLTTPWGQLSRVIERFLGEDRAFLLDTLSKNPQKRSKLNA